MITFDKIKTELEEMKEMGYIGQVCKLEEILARLLGPEDYDDDIESTGTIELRRIIYRLLDRLFSPNSQMLNDTKLANGEYMLSENFINRIVKELTGLYK